MNKILEAYINSREKEFELITPKRKEQLRSLSLKMKKYKNIQFICTHNSRRSIFSQVWAYVASVYYKLPELQSFSGGTEATEVYPGVLNALKDSGLFVHKKTDSKNPIYSLSYSENETSGIKLYSKVFDCDENPKENFLAVMTCSHADENCPFIPGAERFSLNYEDPKYADGKPEEAEVYTKKNKEISREIIFTFFNYKLL